MNDSGELRLGGTPASAGVAIGPAIVIDPQTAEVPDVADPVAAFNEASAAVSEQLGIMCQTARAAGRSEAGDVLEAQALMAQDPMLADAVAAALGDGAALDAALQQARQQIEDVFAAIDDPYIAARAQDVVEVTDRIRRQLAGIETPDLGQIDVPSVLVARALTAADTAALDPAAVLGFVTEAGGPTSHVAIIARSLGVAAVVGATGIVERAQAGVPVAIDGSTGDIVVHPTDVTVEDFAARREALEAAIAAADQFRGVGVALGDHRIQVPANVGSRDDVERAVAAAAEGIGLLRTEFLFLDRSDAPSEDEQLDFYSFAGTSFSEPVVIRTFDIGGDKPAPYLSIAAEENPFLGVRGARLYSQFPEVFETQVRAILRAATDAPIWLMLPMVSTVTEIRALRDRIVEVSAGLTARGIRHDLPPIGIMVEVPSVALIADAVAPHVDFFSIGTNDLTQYAMAADRTNIGLDELQDPLHPAVLALCERTVAAAKRNGIGVSVCGLAAADPLGAAAFAAMGVDKLSVSPRAVNLVKSAIATMDASSAESMILAALGAATADEARGIIANPPAGP
ncbi:phosphoenolpyruvate--protein phosphotransferase [Candidatus Poriferisodalis sp.]|uniref:phosphoenolpyruvate--protein phosphotransferase n=1 Tax=Candidatus Poriferisodalis sp. TaxID=3101277 RepID=UPI003B02B633